MKTSNSLTTDEFNITEKFIKLIGVSLIVLVSYNLILNICPRYLGTDNQMTLARLHILLNLTLHQ